MNKDDENNDIISRIIEFYKKDEKYNEREYDWGPDVGREILSDEYNQNNNENKHND